MTTLDDVLNSKPQVSTAAGGYPVLNSTDQEFVSIHTKGLSSATYWEKVKMAFALLVGANIYYSNCVTVRARFDATGSYLGIDHYSSLGQLVVGLGDIKSLTPVDKLHPITHVKIVGNEEKKVNI